MRVTLHFRVEGSPDHDQVSIREAAAIVRRGGLVAFPTETVYGLGANALDHEAVLRIFEAKQRPAWDPIIVHASSLEMLRGLVREWPQKADILARSFMPGPITLLLPKNSAIPSECTAGRDTVGVRIPSHPVASALIEAAGVPIAAPSANRFGHTSPTTAGHVLHDLDGRIDAILDAGPCLVGVESTVIDPMADPPVIYRPGGVTREQIESVIGPVTVAEPKIEKDVPPESLASPGLGIRHYAPRATLVLVANEAEMTEKLQQALAEKKRVGVMRPLGWLAGADPRAASISYDWGAWADLETLARRVYDGLRRLDEQDVEIIFCAIPPEEGMGLAIRDRLRKAAR